MSRQIFAAIIGLLALWCASDAFFVVSQTEQALVLYFDAIDRTVEDPGLHFKWPFAEQVVTIDRRVQKLDTPGQSRLLNDKKWLVIDSYVLYRIVDPSRFYTSVHDRKVLETQLTNLVNSAVQNVLTNRTVRDVLSDERPAIYAEIKAEMTQQAQRLGTEIVDVRIRRAEFPPEINAAMYQRMKSERKQEAEKYRGEGRQIEQIKKANADRDRVVILAEAQRDAEILRGEGDSKALAIINAAALQDANFYAFYRSLTAYQNSLHKEDTSLVLSPDMPFFRYLQTPPAFAPVGH